MGASENGNMEQAMQMAAAKFVHMPIGCFNCMEITVYQFREPMMDAYTVVCPKCHCTAKLTLRENLIHKPQIAGASIR